MANISQLNNQRTRELFEKNAQSSLYAGSSQSAGPESGSASEAAPVQDPSFSENVSSPQKTSANDADFSKKDTVSPSEQKGVANQLRSVAKSGKKEALKKIDPTGAASIKDDLDEKGVLGAGVNFAKKRAKWWIAGVVATFLPEIVIGGTLFLIFGLFLYRYPRLARFGSWVAGFSAKATIWVFVKFLNFIY